MSMPNSDHEEYKSLKAGHWILLFVFLSIAVFLVQKNATDFHASVLPTKQAAKYDGTALPVLKAPKWTALTTDEYKLDYNQIPSNKMVALPKYDAAQLKTATENLGWKSESDLNIRNAKITFSTPYMGNYKLDGVENAGSHLAVDIKVPDGTPVYAIGNGIVTKASNQTTGFGKHLVVKHENFPSLANSSVKTTLYSSYSHLGEILVAEGVVVTKGQMIGKSGRSGTSTTPHVHFQIDNDQAPWHPYWPFTFQEASDAGLSFFEAVNAGLGADKALKTTVNPMMYVQKYLNGSSGSTGSSSDSDSTPDSSTSGGSNADSSTSGGSNESELPPAIDPQPETPSPSPEPAPAENSEPAKSFKITHDNAFIPNVAEKYIIEALTSSGGTATAYVPNNKVYLQTLVGSADMPAALDANEFRLGLASFEVTPLADSALVIKANDGTITGESEAMLVALFADLNTDSSNFKAINFLKNNSVIGGYPDGTFKPDNVVSRVEALKFILNGSNARLIADAKLPFKDAVAGEWYFDFVATGFSKGIVQGYPDGRFKPANTVNRVEFLKMLLNAMEVQINPAVPRDPYLDVPKDAWFATYVRYAKDKNLFEVTEGKFRPEEGMTREEVAEAIYRMVMIKLSGADSYDSSINVASANIDRYFN